MIDAACLFVYPANSGGGCGGGWGWACGGVGGGSYLQHGCQLTLWECLVADKL